MLTQTIDTNPRLVPSNSRSVCD